MLKRGAGWVASAASGAASRGQGGCSKRGPATCAHLAGVRRDDPELLAFVALAHALALWRRLGGSAGAGSAQSTRPQGAQHGQRGRTRVRALLHAAPRCTRHRARPPSRRTPAGPCRARVGSMKEGQGRHSRGWQRSTRSICCRGLKGRGHSLLRPDADVSGLFEHAQKGSFVRLVGVHFWRVVRSDRSMAENFQITIAFGAWFCSRSNVMRVMARLGGGATAAAPRASAAAA